MKARVNISTVAAILGGSTFGMMTFVLLQAIIPAGGMALAVVAAVCATLVAAALPCYFLRQPSRKSQEFAALDLIADEVWLIAPKAHSVQYMNAAARLRSGLSFEGGHGAEIWDVVPQDQHLALSAALNSQKIIPDIFIGTQQFFPTVTEVEGGKYLMLVLRDVTRARKDEAAKDDFISTVSHELRSPLTSIKGSMGLLLSNAAGELPKPARGLLEIAHRNAERLVLIINDILDLQKITEGGMSFEAQDVDVTELVHEAIAASSLFLQRFDLDINVVGAQAPVALNSDPNRIIQVLGNLLTNAAKFSKPRGAIAVTIVQTPESVTISVRDEGLGIPVKEQDKIFERFADMSNSNRHKNGGSGLGLSICKAIVDTLGGTITFESVENVGTTFSICLPRNETCQVGCQPRDDIRQAS